MDSLLNLQDQIGLWDVLDVIFSSHCGSGLWRGIILLNEWLLLEMSSTGLTFIWKWGKFSWEHTHKYTRSSK